MLLDRLVAGCTSVLPDATVVVTGSLALGDYRPGKSDVDLLVLSDAPTDGLVEAVKRRGVRSQASSIYASCGTRWRRGQGAGRTWRSGSRTTAIGSRWSVTPRKLIL